MVVDIDGWLYNILLLDDDRQEGWDEVLGDLELLGRVEEEILEFQFNRDSP